jgi:hypothetical protein
MKTHYGGQALIEGVLMRGKQGVFVAVRAPDGRVVTREERLTARTGLLARLPVVRGVLALGDTISVGTKMLLSPRILRPAARAKRSVPWGGARPWAGPWPPRASSQCCRTCSHG